MKDFLRLLRLFEGSWRWILAGIGLSVLVILANVGLLALSGWFIAAMALAGLGTHQDRVFSARRGDPRACHDPDLRALSGTR